MRSIQYGDETISDRELMYALPSIIVGVSILSLPNQVANATKGVDGWISIIGTGVIITLVTYLAARLATRFHRQTFLSYASSLISRPVAILVNLFYTLISILVIAYVVRAIADIAKQYIFHQTPVEIIALSFLLVVVYAVCGSRVGLFRINMLFLPIIFIVILVVIFFNIRFIELNNYLPLFNTTITEYLQGMRASMSAYVGFGIVLFYVSIVRDTKDVPRKVIYGMVFPIIFYLIIYLAVIGVFSNVVSGNLLYPTVELSKRVEFPGAIFERIESIFFTVWIMAIFTTAAMSLDVAVLTINSIWKKVCKRKIVFALSPIIYYLAMFPEDNIQAIKIAGFIGDFSTPISILIIVTLATIAKFRGGNENAK